MSRDADPIMVAATPAENIDPFGVVHTTPPGRSAGRGPYNTRGAGYFCGCQPIIHRFKCAACGRVVGWCMGAADENPNDCDDCAVPSIYAKGDDEDA